MTKQIRPALVLLLLLAGVTGLAYPLAVTGIAQAAFPAAANGGLIERDGTIIGSSLIGQTFTGERYFHARPSEVDHDAAGSGGSNLGATSATLAADVAARRDALVQGQTPVPADAVTASGSGLDPHISPAYAGLQVERVAKARGLDPQEVAGLVANQTQQPLLGVFGEPAVNVLTLNLALDALESDNG
ncbi:potassium-transporting ATPase subunit KdpC [Devosia nitrariae]|uniref:potassium-transporting ATPase subunit KdpC n=1 Tax=Devosia nitrariae TaxID=2071872 RepID=UPI0024E0FBA3|nr:potassium-transporting ATPase subunit KdpC [Devosia nitrariae]